MPGVADILREIHRLRLHAREMQAEIDRNPIVLKAHRNRAAKVEETFREGQETLKKVKVSAHEKEVSLKSASGQLAKYEKQLDTVVDTKQMEAFKHQIDHTKTTIATLEDEALAALGEIDERTAQLPELEKAAKQAKADLAAFERDQSERLARQSEELKSALAGLATAEGKLPAEMRPQYQRIVNAYGADSLASVEGNTCRHCHTHITSQQGIELLAGEFVLCKSCGRGLYLPE